MTIVEQIHQEIDTATDRLLEKAVSIIENTKVPEEAKIESKAKRMEALGFTSTIVSEKAKILAKNRDSKIKQVVLNEEQASVIQYYKQKYPFYKFLTEAELERICNKYNLIYAPVKNYIKDIPEKNLIELEKGQRIEENDQKQNVYKITKIDTWYSRISKEQREKILNTEYSSYDIEYERRVLKAAIGENGDFCRRYEYEEINYSGLFIAAPKSHFNIKGLKKNKKGFFSVQKFRLEPKDPIVFQYVKGGIIVKTKWGDEAEDPALVNELFN